MKKNMEAVMISTEMREMFDFHQNELIINYLENSAGNRDMQVNQYLFKKLINKYAEAEKELVELNDLKNKFLGMAAHDLRNPLTAIIGFSQILVEEITEEFHDEQAGFAKRILNASQNMMNLLDDLLDVSMIESGKLNLKLEKTSLKGVVENCITICTIIAEKKNIIILMELSELYVHIDADKIGQVINNYLTNAIKFSNPDTKIQISLSEEGSMAVVKIKDEGPGIPTDEIKNVFGEFQRLSVRPTAGEKSTGLGLSIAKKIIEAHNGEVGVESEVGNGSTFIFKIPLDIVDTRL